MENKIEKPLSEYRDYGSWHSGGQVALNQYFLTLRGMITGCGIAQITGITYLNYPDNKNITKEEFIKKFDKFKSEGIGGVLCTLGQNHYEHEKRLLNLGFELISEYANYRHGSSGHYKQKLYILKL